MGRARSESKSSLSFSRREWDSFFLFVCFLNKQQGLFECQESEIQNRLVYSREIHQRNIPTAAVLTLKFPDGSGPKQSAFYVGWNPQ